MRPSRMMIGLLLTLSWISIASCGSKVSPVPRSAATVQCGTDCVPVSKAFLKEHADLYDEVIRLRAAVKFQREK